MNNNSQTKKLHLKIGGLSCSFCVESIKKALRRIEGVQEVSVSLSHEETLIQYDPEKTSRDELEKTLTDLGYTIRDPRRVKAFEEQQQELADGKRKIMVAAAFTGTSLLLMIFMWNGVRLFWFKYAMLGLALGTMFGPGLYIKKKAWQSLKRGILNQHNLLEFGAFSGLIGGSLGFLIKDFPIADFFAVSVFVTTYHILSGWASLFVRTKASQAVQKLLNLQPKTAQVIVDGKEVTKETTEVSVGEIVRIRPGERVPIDGKIIKGNSTIDESIVTGESLPVEKEIGDEVVGGSVNQFGSIDIRITKIDEDTFLQQVIKHVEEARALKPGILIIVDRVLKVYVPVVLIFGIGAFLFWTAGAYFLFDSPYIIRAIYATLAVFVMGYPCALGMAMPLALIRGGGKAAERGILLRSGEAFQTFPQIDSIVFDKTGTITVGKPEVVDLFAVDGDQKRLLAMAATAETLSEHPLADAIVVHARREGVSFSEPQKFESVSGKGVRANLDGKEVLIGKPSFIQGQGISLSKEINEKLYQYSRRGETVVAIATNKSVIGLVGIADTVKKDAKETVSALSEMGIKPIILTGDNEQTAQAIAHQVGITDYFAEVLPDEKAEKIRALQKQGRKVAMVGDGINDAPALMQADVGIAIGAGTDIAIESSDIIIMGEHLRSIIDAHQISKESYTKTKQNLILAFAFNGIGVPAAATGLVHPVWAMIAMAASVTTVLLNSFGGLLFQRNLNERTSREIAIRLKQEGEAIGAEGEVEMETVTFSVPGIHCSGCIKTIGMAVSDCGVKRVMGDANKKKITLYYDGKMADENRLRAKIETLGYEVAQQ